jgi:acyl-CoA hydrolase
MGVGSIPDAILQSLGDRRDLGVHSGMVTDALVDLVETGVVTNARKPIDPGVSITGILVGTERLYRFAHMNHALGIRDALYTHGDAALIQLPNLVSINSAMEVDLTGQVGAEHTASEYIGGIGGQSDYIRAGQRAPQGHAILALPATARGQSRIVARLSGSVTTPRSDVDVVVTEYGAAELRAQSLRERARRLIAIAHPDHREALEREAHGLFRRGF